MNKKLIHKLPLITTTALCAGLALTSCPGDSEAGAAEANDEIEIPAEVGEAEADIKKAAQEAADTVTEDNADSALDDLEKELSGDGE